MPLGQLDGGRIAGALSKWFLVGGLGGGGALIYYGVVHSPLFYLIMLSATYTTYERFFLTQTMHPTYYRMLNGERIVWSAAYFGLIFVLISAMAANKKHLKSVRQLREERMYETNEGVQQISENEQFLDTIVNWNQDDPYFTGNDLDEQYIKDNFTSNET